MWDGTTAKSERELTLITQHAIKSFMFEQYQRLDKSEQVYYTRRLNDVTFKKGDSAYNSHILSQLPCQPNDVDNPTYSTFLATRLGLPVGVSAPCPLCGEHSDGFGRHATKCQHGGGGRLARSSAGNAGHTALKQSGITVGGWLGLGTTVRLEGFLIDKQHRDGDVVYDGLSGAFRT